MSGADPRTRLFGDPTEVLRRAKGTLSEVPLPVLLDALVSTRRTGALELKRQGIERVIQFDAGAPVGCTSNLVAESLGRYLVEKGVLDEPGHLKLVAASAQRGLPLEALLAQVRTVDAAVLNKHVQANLAKKILECFRMGDAQFRVLGGGEIPSGPRMNGVQLIFTGICTTLPIEEVSRHFKAAPGDRFARVHAPTHAPGELKLSGKDERLFQALARRPTLAELVQEGFDEEAVLRRVYALTLLGYVDRAENVPERPPAPVLTSAPPARDAVQVGSANEDLAAVQRSGPGKWVALVAGVLAVAAIAGYLVSRPAPEAPAPVVIQVPAPPEDKPTRQLPAFTAAPAGARAQPHKPRNLTLSASGIPLPVPEEAGPHAQALGRANARLLAADPDAALKVLEEVTRIAPTDARAWYGTALGLYELGRDAEARAAAMKAVAADDTTAWAHLVVAYFEQQQANLPVAVQHYERFLTLKPSDPHAEDVRAIVQQLQP